MSKLDKIYKLMADGEKVIMTNFLDSLGEVEDLDNWELIDVREVDYDKEDELDAELLQKFANTGKASPNKKSSQDGKNEEGDIFRVRYQYDPLRATSESREFCKKMVNDAKIYRKEDIQLMGTQPVNKGWGPSGAATYDIWLYKGGGSCHHRWYRKTYMRKAGDPIQDLNTADDISTTEARSKGFRPEPNEQEVPVKPKDMPNRGFIQKRNWKS